MTKETTVARILMVLVFAPAGGLFGKSVAEAAAGRAWWPPLVAAVAWLVVVGLGAVALWNRVSENR
jgi:CHASE2 domain-containing sensor protein